MTNDELSNILDEKFAGVDDRLSRIDTLLDKFAANIEAQLQDVEKRFEGLDQKMEQGFNDSKTRDAELRGLMTFGLEARDVLRDEMHSRFDAADRRHDEHITLLKDAVQHLNTRR